MTLVLFIAAIIAMIVAASKAIKALKANDTKGFKTYGIIAIVIMVVYVVVVYIVRKVKGNSTNSLILGNASPINEAEKLIKEKEKNSELYILIKTYILRVKSDDSSYNITYLVDGMVFGYIEGENFILKGGRRSQIPTSYLRKATEEDKAKLSKYTEEQLQLIKDSDYVKDAIAAQIEADKVAKTKYQENEFNLIFARAKDSLRYKLHINIYFDIIPDGSGSYKVIKSDYQSYFYLGYTPLDV